MSNSLSKSAGAVAFRWAFLVVCFPAIVFGEVTIPGPVSLRENQTFTSRELRVDEPVTYVFKAVAGEAYLIEVNQQNLDFIVTVEGPDRVARSYNSPLERDESEFVVVDAARSGAYEVTVSSDEPTNASGTHSIRFNSLDGIKDTDIEAWRLMTQGAAANASDAREAKQRAVGAYERAEGLWRELGNSRLEAQALYSVAKLEYEVEYNWSRSADLAAVVTERYRLLNDPVLYANAIFLEANALVEEASELQGDNAKAAFDRAFELFSESYGIHEPLGNIFKLGHIKNSRGLTHFRLGHVQEAERVWREAVPLFASLDEWREESNVRQNLAVIDLDRGYYDRATETFRYILDNLPADNNDQPFRATVLENLATSYRESGNVDEALRTFSEALGIYREVEDRVGEAYSLRGIGGTYYAFGELQLAQQFLEQALPISRETNDGRAQAGILTSLGNIAFLNAEYLTALNFHRSASNLTNSQADLAYRQVLIAKDLTALGRVDEAIESAQSARETSEGVGELVTLADAFRELGFAHLAGQMPEIAAQYLDQGLRVYESIDFQLGRADALNGLAKAAYVSGNLEEAIEHSAESLRQAESLREKLAAPELRASYAATRRSYYETHIDLLMARHEKVSKSSDQFLREALSVSEHARARLTIELLGEAAADIQHDIAPEFANKRRQLFQELTALQHQKGELLNLDRLDGNDRSVIDQLLDEMAVVENDLNLLELELREANPSYAALVAPRGLDSSEIQRLLDEDTVLLQYSLGSARSFVWVVTGDSILAIELADRNSIEIAARRTFESLKVYQSGLAAKRELDENLARLADYVLSPVADLLGKKRILVAVDGALQYIPFGVLPIRTDGETRPLLETHEIVGLPSMSVVAAQRSRQSVSDPEKVLAVFADPVLEATDPRLQATEFNVAALQRAPSALMTRSSVGATLERLAATGEEAIAIGALVPEDRRLIANGFAANRADLLDMNLSQFRFIHFATHGLVDSRYPALSALALSQLDQYGRPQNGFLRLHDIYSLKLNADLVVLSACETALGREIRGEGLIGLVQGFMYAGARRLVVSLWQVPDRATAELMTRFYRYMFDGELHPADALRQAQMSIAAERRWNDPYFWGGFLLLGDWG